MKHFGLPTFLLASLLLVGFCLSAQAHDMVINGLEFATLGTAATQTANHADSDPWKGYAFVSVTNTGTQPWGDFHFEIIGAGIENVHFDTSVGLASSQTLSGWDVDNVAVGAKLDLYFYGDPVLPGQTATFDIYTDNTLDNVSFFGMAMYPTPVPEPMTVVLLGLGSGAILLRKRLF